jgi:PhoPQ-activated pathogenicity-related protein
VTFRKLTALIRKEMIILLRERQTFRFYSSCHGADFFSIAGAAGLYMVKLTGRQILLIIENESHQPTAICLYNGSAPTK